MKRRIDFPVNMDAQSYRRFCVFDTFRRQRSWLMPVLCGAVLTTLSVAGLLGFVNLSESGAGLMMGIGIAVPLAAIAFFFIQIERQVQLRGLADAPLIYTLQLSPEELVILNAQKDEPPVRLSWDQLWAAFRQGNAIYLYVNPKRAVILPDRPDIAPADELWALIRRSLGEKKCFQLKQRNG